MTHHGHLVQRGLTVEHDHVVINNVALDNVANVQMLFGQLLVVLEIDALRN